MHYSCLILTDDHESGIESIVNKILAPYNEAITVAPYDRDCICTTNEQFRELIASSDSPCPSCHDEGHYRTTRNPNSKWDYYQIGGIWNRMFGSNVVPVKTLLESGNKFHLNEIFAVVEPDGSWNEAHPLYDLSREQAAGWPERLLNILSKHENCRAILCDLHI